MMSIAGATGRDRTSGLRRIAVLQMTSGIDPLANVTAIEAALAKAKDGGAEMLFTPEMALLLDRNRARAAAFVEGGPLDDAIVRLQAAAARQGLWLHIGSAPIADPAVAPRWVNRSLLIAADGTLAAHYDKLHLFDVDLASGEQWRESASYAPGERVAMAETPIGRLGLSVCYDLRFAGLYDRFGAAGCAAMTVPAAFTVPTGAAHWHVLLRARAIEQGAYVIAAAQVGEHPDGRHTYGHSLVVGPWGDVLLDLGGATPGLGFAELDLSAVARARQQIPSILHRRPLGS
jgi:predicted amidohydrolase